MEKTYVGLKSIDPPIVLLNPDETLKRFNLTFGEVKEYSRLKAKIFGKGILKSLFVELDPENEDHNRYNELSKKIVHLHAYMLAHRSEF